MSESEVWFALSGDNAGRALAVDLVRGLNADEVARRREQHGENMLAETPPVSRWKRLLDQFKELVIWILIVAAIISGVMGEWADTAAILAIVLVNGVIGFLQEEKAGRALAALQKLSSPMAKVIRDGNLQSLPARELVPGDRIELEAGDNIPAAILRHRLSQPAFHDAGIGTLLESSTSRIFHFLELSSSPAYCSSVP